MSLRILETRGWHADPGHSRGRFQAKFRQRARLAGLVTRRPNARRRADGPRRLRASLRPCGQARPFAVRCSPVVDELDVIEQVSGGGATEFGIPSVAVSAEAAPISSADLCRIVALLEACWAAFDEAAADAEGVTLTTGPRGGGRSLAKIRDHLRDAEVAYTGQLGSRTPDPDRTRQTFIAALTARVTGQPFEHPRNTGKPWTPRYAVRRVAWHVLDHAWEIEDRSGPS